MWAARGANFKQQRLPLLVLVTAQHWYYSWIKCIHTTDFFSGTLPELTAACWQRYSLLAARLYSLYSKPLFSAVCALLCRVQPVSMS